MLKLAKFEPGVATLEQITEEKDIPELVDFNPTLHRFDTIRYIRYPTNYSRKFIRDFLSKNPGACIYNTVTHYPPESVPANRILLYGEPFIDVFGLYVYIFSALAWSPRSDVDLRFNANHYPYDIIEPELGYLFT